MPFINKFTACQTLSYLKTMIACVNRSFTFLIAINGIPSAPNCNNCDNAASVARLYQPRVCGWILICREHRGIEGVKQIKEARPQTAVIMYTVFEDDEKLFACLCAGANGYLLKKTPPARLFDSIEEVMEGGAPYESQHCQ